MKLTEKIAALLIFVIAFPVNGVYAGKNSKTSMVLVPVHNGNQDELTDRAIEEMRLALKSNSDLYIIDKDKVDSVLHYYDRKETGNSSARVFLAKAKDNYYRFNYIEAKSLAKRAISDIKGRPESVYDSGEELINAYLILGIISRSMGNVGEARQAFNEALRLDPSYRLDSRAFPPSLVNLFEGARESVKTQPRGSLTVDTNPKMAEVYVNGVMKGVTPLTIENMPEGRHFIRISANKYNVVKKEVDVKSGRTVKIKERLSWSGGKLGKLTGENFVSAVGDFEQVDEAVKIAGLLKVDRVILIDVQKGAGGSGMVMARTVDGRYKAGHKPIILPYNNNDLDKTILTLSRDIASQTYVNVASDPGKLVDPPGGGDPVLMGERERGKISKPILFGVLGGVLAAGLGVGLAAAFAGGGRGGGGGTGSVNVNFK